MGKGMGDIFEKGKSKKSDAAPEVDYLERKIGQLTIEIDYLKKNVPHTSGCEEK